MAQKKKKKKVKAVKASPIVNPELRNAIDALKQGNTPEKQQALTEALKNAKLLSPVTFDGEIKKDAMGRNVVQPQQIRVFMINTKDGKSFFPAFTDITETQKFRVTGDKDPAAQNVVRTMADFDKMLRDPKCTAIGVVVNPGSDNIVIPKALVAVAAGTMQMPQMQPGVPDQQTVTAAMNIRYVEPSIYPTRMINAVYDHCAETPVIDRVWFKQKMAGSTPSFWFAVEADEKKQEILDGIIETAIPLAKDVQVEAEFITDKIMEDIIKDAVALYDRVLEL